MELTSIFARTRGVFLAYINDGQQYAGKRRHQLFSGSLEPDNASLIVTLDTAYPKNPTYRSRHRFKIRGGFLACQIESEQDSASSGKLLNAEDAVQ